MCGTLITDIFKLGEHRMKQENVKSGQYWLVEGGSVALITERNGDNSAWLANRVDDRGGIINGVGIEDFNFEKEISADEARKTAMEFVEKRVLTLLDL